MVRDQLFIEDIELDLYPGTLIPLTYQINDLAEIKDRQANYSQQFKVPKTQKNIKALAWSNIIQSTTDTPYLLNSAVVKKQGVQVIPRGVAIIENTDKDFNITVYSGLKDFFQTIDGLSIRDIDYVDLNHVWSTANIYAARTNITGYKWPIINYGDLLNTNRDVDTNNQRPAIFVHEIVNRIFTEAGFVNAGDFFTDANYLKTLLPFAEKKFTGTNANYLAQGLVSADTAIGTNFFPADDSNLTIDPFDLINIEVFATTPGGGTKYFYSAVTNGRFKFELAFDFFDGDVAGFDVEGYIHRAGNATLEIISQEGPVTIAASGSFSTTHTVDLLAGDHFAYRINYHGTAGNMTIVAGGSFACTDVTNILLEIGNTVEFSVNIPDIKQTEFLKSIAQQYALFFARDSFTDKVYAARMNDIIANIPKAINWSDKLDDGQSKLEYRLNYAQNNWLKYAQDGEDKKIVEGTGDGYFECVDETLEKEKTLVTLPFAATYMEKLLMNLDIPNIQMIDDDGEFTLSAKPRMLIDDTQDIIGIDITYDDGTGPITDTNDIPLCYFQLPEKDFNLGFDDSLIPDYYDGLVQSLSKLKKITASFKLTVDDVAKLNTVDPNTDLPYWFTPIYLWQFSSYFYINKVVAFTGKGLTKVELIRLGGGDVCIPEFGDDLLNDGDFPSPNGWWIESGEVGVTFTYGLPGVQKDNPGVFAGTLTNVFSDASSPVGKFKATITVTGRTQGECWSSMNTEGVHRSTNGTFSDIFSYDGIINGFSINMDADFDGIITLAILKAQLTCGDNESD